MFILNLVLSALLIVLKINNYACSGDKPVRMVL